MKKPKYKQITVRWADHWIEYGDQTLKFIKDSLEPVCGTYTGYLIAENKQVLVLCANLWDMEDGEASYSDPMFIMKGCIMSRSDDESK